MDLEWNDIHLHPCTFRFGEQLAEFTTDDKSWVTCVAWSASGESLAFATQSSIVYIVDCSSIDASGFKSTTPTVLTIKEHLPFSSLIFSSESLLIGAGYNGNAILMETTGGQWKVGQKTLLAWKQNNNRTGDNCISCLKTSSLGLDGNHVSATGAHGLFAIIKV